MTDILGWSISDWQQAYQNGAAPIELLSSLLAALNQDDPAWISVLSPSELQEILRHAPEGPLHGIPFAVKDNIDVAGFNTTAACPSYSTEAHSDAQTVALLRAAGAIPIGKTNLDQFATGLVGTRSPYGAVPNPFNAAYIGGGSSSGSASVVSRGIVPFALGTDTAGSGRVPAGLTNIVGLKPTPGAWSTRGVVPACRSLDCVSVFAYSVSDAALVADLLEAFDPEDPFSREHSVTFAPSAPAFRRPGPLRRLGIPSAPPWFEDRLQADAWQSALNDWRTLGIELVEMDFSPLWELAALLYEGPWVAERYAAVGPFIEEHGESINPVVRGIIEQATTFSAIDTFNAVYRKQQLLRDIDQRLAELDGLLVPTAPLAPTIDSVNADPVRVNAWMGTYTNFVNLADFTALAVPAGFRSDELPFGVTLISGAWKERELQQLAQQWLDRVRGQRGATQLSRPEEQPIQAHGDTVPVAVVGAHLTGMPLNPQLTERGARRQCETTTAPRYRLYALPDTTPPKPGLQRSDDGAAIIVEVWDIPVAAFGSFVDLVPSPLGIGTVELADGRWVNGFICEGYALEGARDITELGGWRAYIQSLQNQ